MTRRAQGLLILAMAATPLTAHADACMSASGQTIAVSCAPDALRVSRDDGATFTEVAAHVRAATVTSDEVVFALSDSDAPSLLRFGTQTTSQPIPLERATTLRSLGNALFVAGWRDNAQQERRTFVLTSEDAGASWRELGSLPAWSDYSDAFHVTRGRAHPEIELIVPYGLSCWGTVQVRRFRYDGQAFQGADLINDNACAGHGEACSNLVFMGVGAHASAFAVGHAPEEEPDVLPLLTIGPVEQSQATDLQVHPAETFLVADNGRITLAIAGTRLVRIEGTHHTLLDRNAPLGATQLFVDERGRAWVLSQDLQAPSLTQLHRFSRRVGWQAMGIAPRTP